MTPTEASHQLRIAAGLELPTTSSLTCSASIESLHAIVEASLSQNELRKWRARILDRDRGCVMCGDDRNLEAHHCKPKSLYPVLAYDDDNGVMLCYRCHRVIVHASNTWDLSNWQRFMPLWGQFV